MLALIAIQSIGAYLVESGVISDKIRFEHEKGLIIEPEAAIIIERLGSFMHVVTSKDIISGIGIGKNFASGCMVCLLSCEEVVVI